MVGWIADLPILRSVLPGLNQMKPNTATALIFIGLAALLIARRNAGEQSIAVILAAMVSALGFLSFVEDFAGIDLGIDTLIIDVPGELRLHSIRMATVTALILTALGIIAILLAANRGLFVATILSSFTVTVGALFLLEYLFGSPSLYDPIQFNPIALNTASCVVLSSFSLLALNPTAKWFHLLFERGSVAAKLARQTIPIVIAISIIATFIRLAGEERGLYSAAAGLAGVALLNVVLFCVVIIGYAQVVRSHELAQNERERALAESEARWRAAFLNAGVGIVHRSAEDGRLTLVNPRFAAMLGYDPQELTGRLMSELTVPEEAARNEAELKRLLRGTADLLNLEKTLVRRDGERVTASVTSVPVRDLDGRPLYIVTVAEDVTERRAAEQALRLSDERFRLAANAANDVVYDANLATGAIWWSDALQTVFGFAPDCAGGREWWRNHIDPKVRDEVMHRLSKVITSGERHWSAEYRFQRADGSWADVSDRGFIMQGGRDGPLRLIGALRDLSQIREAERVLREASAQLEQRVRERTASLEQLNDQLTAEMEARTRVTRELVREKDFTSAIIGTSGALIVVLDRERRIVRFNAACERLTGYLEAEVIGRDFADLFLPPEEREATLAVWDSLMTGPVKNEHENHWLTRRGERRLMAWRNSSIEDESGKPLYIIGTGIDVTEERRSRRELEQTAAALQISNEELEAFSYSVSHDLRAPLRAIDGFSQALTEDYGDRLDEVAQRYLQRMRSAASRMALLIDELLLLSRVSKTKVHRKPLDLAPITEDVARRLREVEGRTVRLEIQRPIPASGDERLLTQLIENLLSNAWKFTAHNDDAAVRVGYDESEEAYYVSDNGVGFDMEYAGRLFTPFQRLHHADEFPGSGVGLATVHRIVRRHGGKIWAKAAPDHGATFWFTLGERGIDD